MNKWNRWAIALVAASVSAIVVYWVLDGRRVREDDINSCWYDAIKVYPSKTYVSDEVLTLIPMCMHAKGYDYQYLNRFCPLQPYKQDTSGTNADCYRPTGTIARFAFDAEIAGRSMFAGKSN